MANIKLLTDPEEMRVAASAVSRLAGEFDRIRLDLKTAIGVKLKSACEGSVATEFTNFYNEKIDTKLVAEKDRQDNVAKTLRDSADNFEGAEKTVIASL